MPSTASKFHLTPIILMSALLFAFSCGSDAPFRPAGEAEEERVKIALNNRSFRQLLPSKDASPRKAVVLDFFDGIHVWAQYSEKRHAVDEWEIAAQDYRVLKLGNSRRIGRGGHDPEFMILLDDPTFTQKFPTACEDCIKVSGFSVSIRSPFDGNRISFKLNNPSKNLPPPFPLFESWTRYREDEYFD